MDVTPLIPQGRQIIQSYAGGRFKVSGAEYDGAVIVTPDTTISWNAPKSFAELRAEHFHIENAEVVLLGTGRVFALLPPELKKALKDKGFSVDSMDTGAACRTYNVLMAEGRRVAAALLPAA